MARINGSKKTGGRQRGTPNKKTTELNEYFESINFNIPIKLTQLIPKLDNNKQADILLKIRFFIFLSGKKTNDAIFNTSVKQTIKNNDSRG